MRSNFFRVFFNAWYHQQARAAAINHNAFLFAAPIVVKVARETRQPQYLCEEVSTADKIRGAYENKIRFFSPPEKIFETFASVKTEGGSLVMSYSDFFRSLTAFNYTELKDTKEYFEKFKPAVLSVADVNGDGVIDFPEFFFFVTIL